MITPVVLIHLGRAAEFGGQHHERFIEEPTTIQVRQQRSQGLIQRSALLRHANEVVLVRVPAPKVHFHKAHPVFHETRASRHPWPKLSLP